MTKATMQKILIFILATSFLVLLVSGLSGCQQNAPVSSLSNPFVTNMNYFTLKGYTSGYTPGKSYSFDLTLNNTAKEEWQSKFSVYLIDTQGVVLNVIRQRPFDIPPEASLGSNFDMTLPGDMKDGAYGLLLVFPGRGSSITTLHIGQEAAPRGMPARVGVDKPPVTGPWPDPSNLPQL
jgi:hypothetical protein